MTEYQIYETKEYDKFRPFKGNRPIDNKHVVKLCDSIRKTNDLAYRPIMVNESNEVIDGNHRLAAAKMLGIPIYYQIKRDASYQDAAILNANAANWKPENYVNMYCSHEDNAFYNELNEFLEVNKIDLALLSVIITGLGKTKYFNNSIKNGTFWCDLKDPMLEDRIYKVNQIIGILESRVKGSKEFFRKKTFWSALIKFIENPDVDWHIFKKNLDAYCDNFRPCVRIHDYHENFAYYYNYRRSKEKRLHL